MKRNLFFTVAGMVVLLQSCSQQNSPTAEQRAADLLSQLTLEEKASLVLNSSPAIPRLGIKSYNWWNEALHG
ncbi:MAG: hypothetical protein IJ911_11175, partial [Salinivirgaceae bacterium]|nr:hypothetical protein [Salinivirgaceae bacterium]